jgi:hypothetical protein
MEVTISMVKTDKAIIFYLLVRRGSAKTPKISIKAFSRFHKNNPTPSSRTAKRPKAAAKVGVYLKRSQCSSQ